MDGRVSSRVLSPAVASVLLLVGCSADVPEDSALPVTTISTSAVSTTTALTGSTTTTTFPMDTTVVAPVIEVADPVLWPATDHEVPSLDWQRGDLRVERTEDVWLGSIDDELVVLMWNPIAGLRSTRSDDGLDWAAETTAAGVPPDFEPQFEHFFAGTVPPSIASGPAGIIMRTQEPGTTVLISADGITWTEEDVGEAGRSVAAGEAGFLVAGKGTTECGIRFSADGSEWACVEITGRRGEPWDITAMTGGSRFVVDLPGRALAVIGQDGVDSMPSPAPQSPLFTHATPWRDGLLAIARGAFPGASAWRMALIGTDDYASWFELPVPFIAEASDWQGDGYWNVGSLTAADRGVLLTAHWPPEDFDFRGEGFTAIDFSESGVEGFVFGSRVFLMPPNDSEVEWSFDDGGNLTLSRSGDVLGSVTCAEMRTRARDMGFLIGQLIEWPDQLLAYSPDGTAWRQTDVADLLGSDAYILQLTTTEDKVIALVAPNGDRPTPDPPGCPLNLYPQAQPFEIWVADLP